MWALNETHLAVNTFSINGRLKIKLFWSFSEKFWLKN